MEEVKEKQDNEHMRMYRAKRDIFTKLGPLVDIMYNLGLECEHISNKHEISNSYLKEWVKENIFYILDEDTEESDD